MTHRGGLILKVWVLTSRIRFHESKSSFKGSIPDLGDRI